MVMMIGWGSMSRVWSEVHAYKHRYTYMGTYCTCIPLIRMTALPAIQLMNTHTQAYAHARRMHTRHAYRCEDCSALEPPEGLALYENPDEERHLRAENASRLQPVAVMLARLSQLCDATEDLRVYGR